VELESESNSAPTAGNVTALTDRDVLRPGSARMVEKRASFLDRAFVFKVLLLFCAFSVVLFLWLFLSGLDNGKNRRDTPSTQAPHGIQDTKALGPERKALIDYFNSRYIAVKQSIQEEITDLDNGIYNHRHLYDNEDVMSSVNNKTAYVTDTKTYLTTLLNNIT
jgi:hypothetical protein